MKSLTIATLFAVVSLLSPRVQADVKAGGCPACDHHEDTRGQAKTEPMNRFGGPIYTGAPALPVTASLVEAGGGPENFSIAKALTAMIGADGVKAEVAKL